MSKSKYNVVNPDEICDKYGADTLRMYEMFLGPIEQDKPWNTAGISGVHNFLKNSGGYFIKMIIFSYRGFTQCRKHESTAPNHQKNNRRH